jgi:Caspase domain
LCLFLTERIRKARPEMRSITVSWIAAVLTVSFAVQAGVTRIGPGDAERDAAATGGFDPQDSAALFVGVREFPYDDTLAEVPYAVDDAIDLAHVFAIDAKTKLVEPHRVVLALSGDPQKPESQRNLEELVESGATVHPAGLSDVLTLLDSQQRAAGKRGILIIAFATHGVSEEGTQDLLTATSLLRYRQTMLSERTVSDIARRSAAARSVILIDACRRRLLADQRDSEPDPRSAAPLIRAMDDVSGQVVFSAAAPGEYAFDDPVRGNGVFTAAIIDGLRCAAPSDSRGLVTVGTLSAYVEERVLEWVRKHRDPQAKRATQLVYDGRSNSMPLADCGSP